MSIDPVDLPPFALGFYRNVLPTTGAGLPTSIKAKGKTLQVRLPAQVYLIVAAGTKATTALILC